MLLIRMPHLYQLIKIKMKLHAFWKDAPLFMDSFGGAQAP